MSITFASNWLVFYCDFHTRLSLTNSNIGWVMLHDWKFGIFLEDDWVLYLLKYHTESIQINLIITPYSNNDTLH